MKCSKQEFETIVKICERAEDLGVSVGERITLIMDLENTHNTIGLALDALLEADDANFAHDIIGIQANINRETKEMDNFFMPRYAKAYHPDVADVIKNAVAKSEQVGSGRDNVRADIEKDIEQ